LWTATINFKQSLQKQKIIENTEGLKIMDISRFGQTRTRRIAMLSSTCVFNHCFEHGWRDCSYGSAGLHDFLCIRLFDSCHILYLFS
jgi:hypothetical protein